MGDTLFIIAGPSGWRHVEGSTAFDVINAGLLDAGIQILENTEDKLNNFLNNANLGQVMLFDTADMLIIRVGPGSARAAGVL